MIAGIERVLPASEIAEFEACLLRFPDRCVRLRVDRSDAVLPFATKPVPWNAYGRWLDDSSIRPGGTLPYAAADYYIQDAASLLPIRLANIQAKDRVCDLCAAPGGKASACAEMLGPEGFLIANEAIRSRVDVLRYNLARTGRANYATTHLDPRAMAGEFFEVFDTVLVDVPCSGQSMLGRDKHDLSALSAKHVEMCAARGRRILRSAIDLVRPGGVLVYATCTFAIEENEAQIAWLRETFPNAWEAVHDSDLDAWRSPLLDGCYRLWPHRDRCSGGFAACLRKLESTPADPDAIHPQFLKKGQSGAKSKSKNHRLEARKQKPLIRSFRPEDFGELTLSLLQGSESLWGVEPGVAALVAQAGMEPSEASMAWAPPTLAWAVGNRVEPTHTLALLQPSLFRPHRSVALDEESAWAYCSGEGAVPYLREEGADFPFAVAEWNGKPLGWLKDAGTRWNSRLPGWARLTRPS